MTVVFSTGVAGRPEHVAALSGAFLFFLVGLVDDLFGTRKRANKRTGLPPALKFLLQIGAATLCVVGFDLRFDGIGWNGWPAVHLGMLTPVATVAWIVAIVNLYNFMDGIDALAATVAVVLLATDFHAARGDVVFAAGTAAVLGFAVWNRPPARIFLGDGGSHLLGFLIASAACGRVTRGEEFPGPVPWPLVAAPLVPLIVDVGEALIHKARHEIPMSLAHNDHLYQRLVKAGVPTGFVALRYGLLSVAAILCVGPLAAAIGVLPATAVGFAILALHIATAVRRVRGVPRLARP